MNLCEGGATTAALQLLVVAAAAAADAVSRVDMWLTVDIPAAATAAVAVPVALRLVASAIVNLLAPLTTSDSVLLSTTNESPTAVAFDCQQISYQP